VIYVDTSALAKLLLTREPGSGAVRELADRAGFISSRLLQLEMHAVAWRRGQPLAEAQLVIERVHLVPLDDDILSIAIAQRSGLRSLDAIHLATIALLGEVVEAVLTFDAGLRAASESIGVPAIAL